MSRSKMYICKKKIFLAPWRVLVLIQVGVASLNIQQKNKTDTRSD